MPVPALAVHGGAGDLRRDTAPQGYEAAARDGLKAALLAGRTVLLDGGSALEAAIAAVVVLEDCEVFNAGRGSVLRSDGSVAMDAAVMDGAQGIAGAVAAVRGIRNPILAARAVASEGTHVLLVGTHAEAFAREHDLAFQESSYFVTPHRANQLEQARAARRAVVDHDLPTTTTGTVGAVALDAHGHVAAATSTGGTTNAHPGRVGDSPILGAGTWANDATCAISATGYGEFFMRTATAHEIDAGMRLGGLDLETACLRALQRTSDAGGKGGCIAVDTHGRIATTYVTTAMPRGVIRGSKEPRVAVFGDESIVD